MKEFESVYPFKIVYKGAQEICDAVGENYKEIARLVREEGLPAYRTGPNKHWKMYVPDAQAWLKVQRDRYINSDFRLQHHMAGKDKCKS